LVGLGVGKDDGIEDGAGVGVTDGIEVGMDDGAPVSAHSTQVNCSSWLPTKVVLLYSR